MPAILGALSQRLREKDRRIAELEARLGTREALVARLAAGPPADVGSRPPRRGRPFLPGWTRRARACAALVKV